MTTSGPSVETMTRLLTRPYKRGAEVMKLALGPVVAGWTTIHPYDFKEFTARYERPPEKPRYILLPKKAVGLEGLEVEVEYGFGGTQTTTVRIPPGTFGGTSFAIPMDRNADHTARLTRFRMKEPDLNGPGDTDWEIRALLGNVAKLAWVLGWEKDLIRVHLEDVKAQRRRATAHRFSLDSLGRDLKVPRFPTREHSFDAETVALYHLNAIVADGGVVEDETARFGMTGHPGTNKKAQSGVPGKFGRAFRFPGADGTGQIEIAHHAEFHVGAAVSLTVEAFVKADNIAAGPPRVVILKGAVNANGVLTGAGWSLTLGAFRGFANNARWAVQDGAGQRIEAFADSDLADGRFHHLAGIVDRNKKKVRLLVDGEPRAVADIGALGAIQNTQPIQVGSSGAAHMLHGTVDEIRISKAAREDFHPVLGESDAAYRERLGIFERWQLPTPPQLLKTINELVQINNDPQSFVLIEKNRPAGAATRRVRILPEKLETGERIRADGNRRGSEAEAVGTAAEEPDFDAAYLFQHSSPQVDYGADINRRRMQHITTQALDALLALLPAGGKLVVEKAYDPADTGLHRVGRALALRHTNLSLEMLGVLAHRAGFDFVENTGVHIRAGMAPADKLRIVPEAPGSSEVVVGGTVALQVEPDPLPSTGEIRWTLVPCVAGRARFVAHPADPGTLRTPAAWRRRLVLVAEAPGEVFARVEYTLRRRTVTGRLRIRIWPTTIEDQKSISAAGDTKASEAEAVGGPDADFSSIYLIQRADPATEVDFGANPDNKKMQLVLEKPFERLLALLKGPPAVPGLLNVLKAFEAGGAGLHAEGRALRLSHTALGAGQLAVLAHRAGFGFVKREGNEVYCSATAGEKLEIINMADLKPLAEELTTNAPVEVATRPAPATTAGNYNWSVEGIGPGSARLGSVLTPKVRFLPGEPGPVALNVTFLEKDPDRAFPYTFEIRLKPALDLPATIIPRHHYDLLMNILNYFHPIGVEVVTRNVWEHVVEVRGSVPDALPGYTFPPFRT